MRVKMEKKNGNRFNSEAGKINSRKKLLMTTGLFALGASMLVVTGMWHGARTNPDNPDVQSAEKIAEVQEALNSGNVMYRGGTVKGILNPHEDICDNVTFKLQEELKANTPNQVGCELTVITVAEGPHRQWVWSKEYATRHLDIQKRIAGTAVAARFLPDSDLAKTGLLLPESSQNTARSGKRQARVDRIAKQYRNDLDR